MITPGFKLNAKNVIHAVGPVWQDGMHGEPTLLYNVYIHSLELAAKNGCNSIAFPLISAGIYGYPKQAAWIQAITACRDFLLRKKSSIRVIFAVIDDEMFIMGQKTIQSILG